MVSTPEGGWTIPLAVGIQPGQQAGLCRGVTATGTLQRSGEVCRVIELIGRARVTPPRSRRSRLHRGAQDVAVGPDGRRLYVTWPTVKTVEVIDTATHAVLGYFTADPVLGPWPSGRTATSTSPTPRPEKTHAVTVGNASTSEGSGYNPSASYVRRTNFGCAVRSFASEVFPATAAAGFAGQIRGVLNQVDQDQVGGRVGLPPGAERARPGERADPARTEQRGATAPGR